MGILYGRAGRLTAEDGGLRPGQFHTEKMFDKLVVYDGGSVEPGGQHYHYNPYRS